MLRSAGPVPQHGIPSQRAATGGGIALHTTRLDLAWITVVILVVIVVCPRRLVPQGLPPQGQARTAASAMDSPRSTAPPGTAQFPLPVGSLAVRSQCIVPSETADLGRQSSVRRQHDP
jgi:hypothetical protein